MCDSCAAAKLCATPASASAPACIFIPKCHCLPFLVCRISGPLLPGTVLRQRRRLTKLAFTSVPSRRAKPREVRLLSIADRSASPRPCLSSRFPPRPCLSSRLQDRRLVRQRRRLQVRATPHRLHVVEHSLHPRIAQAVELLPPRLPPLRPTCQLRERCLSPLVILPVPLRHSCPTSALVQPFLWPPLGDRGPVHTAPPGVTALGATRNRCPRNP